MQLTLRQGTPHPVVRLFLVGEQVAGVTGLTARSEGLTAAYLRDGDARPTPLALEPWEGDAPAPGAFREIEPRTMPGLYELRLPDAVCAEGAQRATLMVQAPGASPAVIHLDLVAYDPYDRDRLGLDCLTSEARHGVISRAFREVIPSIIEEVRPRSAPGAG